MSVVKVVELIGESKSSWEEAAQSAVDHAAKTVRNIRHVWVEGFQATVEAKKIKRYRCNVKVSFVVDDD